MKYEVRPRGVCPSRIAFELDGDVVHKVLFTGGCDGNLKAISRVVEGMTVEQVEQYFKGIRCGHKDTSCSDQLARAVRAAYEENRKK